MDDGLRITVGNDRYFERTGIIDELQSERRKRPDDLRNQLRAKGSFSTRSRAADNAEREEYYDQLYEKLLTEDAQPRTAESLLFQDYGGDDEQFSLSTEGSSNWRRRLEFDGSELDVNGRNPWFDQSFSPSMSDEFEAFRERLLNEERQSRQRTSPTELLSQKIRSRNNLDMNVDSRSTVHQYNEIYDNPVYQKLLDWKRSQDESSAGLSSEGSQFGASSSNMAYLEDQLLSVGYDRKQRISGTHSGLGRQRSGRESRPSTQVSKLSLNRQGNYKILDHSEVLDRSSEVVFDHSGKSSAQTEWRSAKSSFLTIASPNFRKSELQLTSKPQSVQNRTNSRGASYSSFAAPAQGQFSSKVQKNNASQQRRRRRAGKPNAVILKSKNAGLKNLAQKYKYAAASVEKETPGNKSNQSKAVENQQTPKKQKSPAKSVDKDIPKKPISTGIEAEKGNKNSENEGCMKKSEPNLKKEKTDLKEQKTDAKSQKPDLKKQKPDLKKHEADVKKQKPDLKKHETNMKKQNPDLNKNKTDTKKQKPNPEKQKTLSVARNQSLQKNTISKNNEKRKPISSRPNDQLERYSSVALITSEILRSENADLSNSDLEAVRKSEDINKKVSDSRSEVDDEIKQPKVGEKTDETDTPKSSNDDTVSHQKLSESKQKAERKSTEKKIGFSESEKSKLVDKPSSTQNRKDVNARPTAQASDHDDANSKSVNDSSSEKSNSDQSTSTVVASIEQKESNSNASNQKETVQEKEQANAKSIDNNEGKKDKTRATGQPMQVDSEFSSPPSRIRMHPIERHALVESILEKYAKPKPIPSNLTQSFPQEFLSPPGTEPPIPLPFSDIPNFHTPANLKAIPTVPPPPPPIVPMNKGSNPSNLVPVRFETEEDRRAKRLDYLEKEMEKLLKHHQTEVLMKKQKHNSATTERASGSKEDDPNSSMKENVKKIVGKEPPPIVYNYVDEGNHFCAVCCEESETLLEHMAHLHTKNHSKMMDENHKPWRKSVPPVPTLDPDLTRSLGGMEFVLPVSGYYCELCDSSSADAANAVLHCRSHEHNLKYEEFCKKNMEYKASRRTLVEKIKASCTIAKSLGLPLMPPHKPQPEPYQSTGIAPSRIKITFPRLYQAPSLPMPVTNELVKKRRGAAENRQGSSPAKRQKSHKTATDSNQAKLPTHVSQATPQMEKKSTNKQPTQTLQKNNSSNLRKSSTQTQQESKMDISVNQIDKSSDPEISEMPDPPSAKSSQKELNDSVDKELKNLIASKTNSSDIAETPKKLSNKEDSSVGKSTGKSIGCPDLTQSASKSAKKKSYIPGLSCSDDDEEDTIFSSSITSVVNTEAFDSDNMNAPRDVDMQENANDAESSTSNARQLHEDAMQSKNSSARKRFSTSSEQSSSDIFATPESRISDAEMSLVEKQCDDTFQSANSSFSANVTDNPTTRRADNFFEITSHSMFASEDHISPQKPPGSPVVSAVVGQGSKREPAKTSNLSKQIEPSNKDTNAENSPKCIKLSRESKNAKGKPKIMVSSASVHDSHKRSVHKNINASNFPRDENLTSYKELASASSPKLFSEAKTSTVERSDNIFEQFSFDESVTKTNANDINPKVKLLQKQAKVTSVKTSVAPSAVQRSVTKDQSEKVDNLRPFVQLESISKRFPTVSEFGRAPSALSPSVPITAILARRSAPARALRSSAKTFDSLPVEGEKTPENTRPRARKSIRVRIPIPKPTSGTKGPSEPPPPGTEDD